jgi:hypothetical protein
MLPVRIWRIQAGHDIFERVLRRTLLLAMLVGVLAPASAYAAVTKTLVGSFSAPTYITALQGIRTGYSWSSRAV